jgi:methylthioribose-1-phosphate isomerase
METPAALARQPGDSIYFEDGALHLLDQTLLPARTEFVAIDTVEEVVDAIRRLVVRGAPAIGVAGAYGALLGALRAGPDAASIRAGTGRAIDMIAASRPTARNLFWALEKMRSPLLDETTDPGVLLSELRAAADAVALEVIETDLRLVKAGQEVVPDGARVLTHCNSGPLAALRYGTAVGVFLYAHSLNKSIHVHVDETRPLLQGSRLTAWELQNAGVPYTLICDNMAAQVMRQGSIDLVMTGCDRVAANGDSANKIGTYGLAVLARAHEIPFYIAAPGSTVDLKCATGADISIEERDPDEVRTCGGKATAPPGAPVYNPAFDVTPADYIEGLVTDRGVLRPPYGESLKVFS